MSSIKVEHDEDEVSAANTDSYGNKCESHSITERLGCNDGVVDSHGHVTCTDEQPSMCEVYDSKFTPTFCLSQQIFIDKPNVLHSCDICSKTFLDLYHLQGHMRTHADPLPFTCFLCQQKFPHQNTLKVHLTASQCTKKNSV